MSKSIYRANAKLSALQVKEIRALAPTTSTRELARIFTVGVETVRRVLRGDTWGDVGQDPLPPEVLSGLAAESQARFLARAQAEGLLEEAHNLIDTRSADVVDSGNGGTPPPTDGGKE